jgi:shikimate dehydrogenase
MLDHLGGDTRLYFTVGYPIAQVKSPTGLTQGFAARGANAVQVPIQIAPADIEAFFAMATRAENVDGMVVTVPFKFIACQVCDTLSERARLLGAANVLRRNARGLWHGDMTDGLGFCNAIGAAGFDPSGRRALLIGAGGAGSAIGLSLLDSGVASLAVYDLDADRQSALVAKLATRYRAVEAVTSADPTGFEVIAHATPSGMRADDPLPLDVERLTPAMHVGDVVTAPEVPPLIEAARRRGCSTHTGTAMYRCQLDVMTDFLLGTGGE